MFAQKCSSGYWSNGPIRLQYMPLYGQTFHIYSTSIHTYNTTGYLKNIQVKVGFLSFNKMVRHGGKPHIQEVNICMLKAIRCA